MCIVYFLIAVYLVCELNWSSNLQENNERKTPLLHYFVCFHMGNKRLQLRSYLSEKLPLSQIKTVLLRGSMSHNVLYYQQLSIACYQVSF